MAMETVGVRYKLEFEGADELKNKLNGVGVSADGAGQNTSNLSNQFALGAIKAHAIMIAVELAGQAISTYSNFLRESITLAIQDQAETRKFLAVFGEYAPQVTEQLDNIAMSAGYSRDALQNSASALQDFLVPMGVAREQASGMSVEMLQLAADLAAFNGVPIEEVLGAMKSGLAGMSRPMLQYGVDIRAAAVNQELLTMGVQGGTEAASAAEAAQARLNIMIRNSADANGAAAASMQSADGMIRAMQAGFEDFKEEVGAYFIPVIEEIMPLVGNLAEQMKPLIEQPTKAGAEFLKMISPEVIVFAENFIFVSGKMLDIVAFLTDALTDYVQAYNDLPQAVRLAINPVGELARELGNSTTQARENEEESQQIIDAYARQAEQTRLAAIAQNLMNEEANYSPQILRMMRSELGELTYMSEAAQEWIQRINERLANNRVQIIGVLGPLNQLTAEQLEVTLATTSHNIALYEQWEAMGKGGPAMQSRIAQLREMRNEIKGLITSYGNTNTPLGNVGGGNTEPPKEQFETDDEKPWMKREYEFTKEMQAERLTQVAEYLQAKQELEDAQVQLIIEKEHAVWQSRYEIGMMYTTDLTNTFVSSWDSGFSDLNESFEKMLESWMKKMLASGILSIFSSAMGGGAVGIFGTLLGGGKSGKGLGGMK